MPSIGKVPLLVKAVPCAALILPANMIFEPLGAVGYIAMVLAILLFACWVLSAIWGLHNPIGFRHPARLGLALYWLATVASYVGIAGGPADAIGRASADRWLLTLMGISGVVLVTAEVVRTRADALALTRAVVAAGTVCSLVALWQFVFKSDPLDVVRSLMVGMTDNGGATTFQGRGLLTRVAGNAFTPIELGIVTVMILPLAIWRALFDEQGKRYMHWLQCAAIAFASVLTVSRSAMLGLVVAGLVTLPFLPKHARMWSAVVLPGAVVAVFMAVPGLIATMRDIFSADASTDPSIANRVNNYPRIQGLVMDRPWFGMGPATNIVTDARQILDNQYLQTTIEMGLVGLAAFVCFLLFPLVSSLLCAMSTRDPMLKLLAAAVGAANAVALAGSFTFDSMSFPVFKLICALFVGLSGAVWMVAKRDAATPVPPDLRPTSLVQTQRVPQLSHDAPTVPFERY